MAGATEDGAANAAWHWHPPLPLPVTPVFVLPPQPLAALRWLFSKAYLGSLLVPYVGTALLVWFFVQAPLADCATPAPGWIAVVFLRNLALMLLVAGGLHLYLHRFAMQGATHRFDARPMARNDPRFLFGDQVRDNMFWSCASGVTLWSVFEAAFLWGYANGDLPFLAWSESPSWFVALFVLIPIWQSVHFYIVHRLLHWKPLYRMAHALHHRNVGIGPWSGISMHPVEHVLYFSSVLVHLVLPSHPLHVIFHMHVLVLSAAQSHCGYQDLLVRGRSVVLLGDFFHQLHHRHFTCNFGTDYVPMDRWFGSFHDGTAEATRRLARRGRQQA